LPEKKKVSWPRDKKNCILHTRREDKAHTCAVTDTKNHIKEGTKVKGIGTQVKSKRRREEKLNQLEGEWFHRQGKGWENAG